MALTINLKGDTGEELDGLMPHIAAMSAGHAVPAPHPPMAPIAPPEAGGTPPPIQPMSSITGPTDPNLRMPTKQESHEAGKAEYERGMPSITAQPLTPEHAQQDYAQREYKAHHPWGSDVSEHPGVWGKIGHGLAEAGNIAGNTLVPGLTANIPGSELNNRLHERADRQQYNEAEKNQLESAEAWKNLNAPAEAQKLEQEKEADREKLASSNQSASEQRESERNDAAEKRTQEEIASHEKIAENKPEKPGETDKFIADYLEAHGLPNTAANRQKARDNKATEERAPAQGSWMPLYDDKGHVTGAWNPATGQTKKSSDLPGTTSAGNTMNQKQQEAFAKDYVNPANQIERSYKMFQEALAAIDRGDAKTGAEDMLLLSQHLGTTFGQVKGSRMNRDLIQEHKDAIGLQDRIERFGNTLASGAQLSPDQRKEFNGMISTMRNLTWQMSAKEAVRRGQPLDFLPQSVQLNVKAPDGSTRPVSGDRVQYYLDKGGKLAE